jgi:hypothetical protein
VPLAERDGQIAVCRNVPAPRSVCATVKSGCPIAALGMAVATSANTRRCNVVEEAFVSAQHHLATFDWSPQFASQPDEYERTTLPKLLHTFQTVPEGCRNGSDYWLGDQLSLADFVAWRGRASPST